MRIKSCIFLSLLLVSSLQFDTSASAANSLKIVAISMNQILEDVATIPPKKNLLELAKKSCSSKDTSGLDWDKGSKIRVVDQGRQTIGIGTLTTASSLGLYVFKEVHAPLNEDGEPDADIEGDWIETGNVSIYAKCEISGTISNLRPANFYTIFLNNNNYWGEFDYKDLPKKKWKVTLTSPYAQDMLDAPDEFVKMK